MTAELDGPGAAAGATAAPAARRRPHRLRSLSAGLRVGLAIVTVVLLVALFGPLLATHDPYQPDFMALNRPPGAENWLGTDDIGQDIYSRLLLGARLSLLLGAGAALVALAAGGLLALIAVAVGGWVDRAVFFVVDLVRALPGILFALAIVVALEPGTLSVVIALGVSFAPNFARITRATYLRESGMGYAVAARSFGAGRLRISLRHVMPNIAGALVTQFAIVLPRCIISESVLSFLGVGVAPETPTWGRMIANGAPYIETAPHTVLVPVLALAVLTFGFGLVGDALRRRFDPARREIAL